MYIYIYIYIKVARNVMLTVVRNGLSETSPNAGRCRLHFT